MGGGGNSKGDLDCGLQILQSVSSSVPRHSGVTMAHSNLLHILQINRSELTLTGTQKQV